MKGYFSYIEFVRAVDKCLITGWRWLQIMIGGMLKRPGKCLVNRVVFRPSYTPNFLQPGKPCINSRGQNIFFLQTNYVPCECKAVVAGWFAGQIKELASGIIDNSQVGLRKRQNLTWLVDEG